MNLTLRPPGVFAGQQSKNIIKVNSRRDTGLFKLPNFTYIKNLMITHYAFFK